MGHRLPTFRALLDAAGRRRRRLEGRVRAIARGAARTGAAGARATARVGMVLARQGIHVVARQPIAYRLVLNLSLRWQLRGLGVYASPRRRRALRLAASMALVVAAALALLLLVVPPGPDPAPLDILPRAAVPQTLTLVPVSCEDVLLCGRRMFP